MTSWPEIADWRVPLLPLDGGEPEPPAAPAAPPGPSEAELAYERGFEDGRRAGLAEAERLTESARQALAGAVQSLEAVQAAFAGEAEESLYALAVAAAQLIVQRELATDPTILRDLVRRALELLPLDTMLEIRLNPDDLAALGGAPELAAPGGRRLDVQWATDRAIDRGGFVIETPQRVVDGRVETMLAALYERLRHA